MTLPIALAVTAVFIALLCRRDPKRRRTASLPGKGQRAGTRRILAGLACMPGVFLAVTGDAAAFLLWLGASSVAGWSVTLWFAGASSRAA